MHRRNFLKSSVACATAASAVRYAPAFAASNQQIAGRQVIPFDHNWLWSRTLDEGATEREFNEESFTAVTLPHSNVFVPWHNIDQRSYQFASIYRKYFSLPPELRHQRIFIDFEGVMTSTKLWLNGALIGEYAGGFTPFSFELTESLDFDRPNILAVEVNSREQKEIPPFGYELDYLTYGGIYRQVSLRAVPRFHISEVFAYAEDVMTSSPGLSATIHLSDASDRVARPDTVELSLLDKNHQLATTSQPLKAIDLQSAKVSLSLTSLKDIKRWELDAPHLYQVRVRLLRKGAVVDEQICVIGFREAVFTPEGFRLNGRILKLRGLNRHQSFPFAGPAMAARVQHRDAYILKHELKCNVVRCSHYPQSRHFLDACDRLGLLVIDETPGWQHVGDSTLWRERYLDNTRRMVERDRHHPSVILWSVRINESRDFHELYKKVNDLAHSLDTTRQTTGVRYFQESELLEDVFSMNDFTFPLKTPNHPLYLNTEFVGAEFPVRPGDDNSRHREQILRYAEIYNQIAGDKSFSGGLGWCAFDYQTHEDFGAGDHICYHGVMDTFRQPKPAAGFFRSQCAPSEEPVLEPGFHFAQNDQPGGLEHAVICSNCEAIRCSIKKGETWHHVIDLSPDRTRYSHLAYPPFFLTLPDGNDDWGDLKLEGIIRGTVAITRMLSSKGIDQQFILTADDTALIADGMDATRVAMTITDEYGARRPLSNDPIEVTLEGPAILLGTPTLALVAGTAAVWIRTTDQPGTIRVSAKHPVFGIKSLTLNSNASDIRGL
ncbi:beta-galactosidase [Granulicella aggregans]|uniref:Beta-galactosidase n=1 Tax=Granulicella aggregans TaxID=474949 RepID=A0A7W7ZFZ5_9BACT|nr:glycoside hydrolase family 2 protein [Granulicella aggregans]MBB5059122.1 beta-galactosidase [Granulicella aggregans]